MSLKDYESNINPSRTLSPPSWEVHPLKVTAPTMMVIFIEGYWRLINHPQWGFDETSSKHNQPTPNWDSTEWQGNPTDMFVDLKGPGWGSGPVDECWQLGYRLNLSELEKIWSWIKATFGRVTVTPCYTYYNHHSSDITVRSVYFLPDKWLWRKVHQWFNEPSKLAKFVY